MAEGLCVQLAASADRDGLWALDISVRPEKVREIRCCLKPVPPPFAWATCVNGWLGESS